MSIDMADRTEVPSSEDDAAATVAGTGDGAGSGSSTDTGSHDPDTILNEIFDRHEAARVSPSPTGDDAAAAADGKRDTAGRFVAKGKAAAAATIDPKKPPVDGAAAAAVQGKPVDPKPAAGEAQGQQALQAPADWPAEMKAQFAKVPAEGKSIVLDTVRNLQADYTRKSQAIAGERKRYETLNRAIAPIEAEAKKFNVTTDAAIQGLWAAHAMLLDPATRLQAIKRIAEDYDIDLVAANGVTSIPHNASTAATAIPPELDARLTTVERTLEQGREQERQSNVRQFTQTAQNWIDEKAEDGTPKRPHMAALEKSHKAFFDASYQTHPDLPFPDRLQYAYDAACAADPTIRQKMIEDAASKKTSEALARDREHGTQAAAASAVTISRSGSSRGRSTAPANVDVTLDQIWKKAGYGGNA